MSGYEEKHAALVKARDVEGLRRLFESQEGEDHERTRANEMAACMKKDSPKMALLLACFGLTSLRRSALLDKLELLQRIDDLERRVGDLQQRGYQGVWKRGTVYRRGDFVTDHGSMWAVQEDTDGEQRPGSSAAFQLAVKRGADGRDAG